MTTGHPVPIKTHMDTAGKKGVGVGSAGNMLEHHSENVGNICLMVFRPGNHVKL